MYKQLYFLQQKVLCSLMLVASFLIVKFSNAQAPVLSLTPVINTGLSSPIQFVSAEDGTNRVFIVQKDGTIRAYDASFNFLSTFLTVSNVSTDGERGLLSMAFHPDYPTNGFFYVYYTNTNGDLELARYHVSTNANIADAASKQIVITIPHPTNANHNGGELHFGPDGFLYLSTGDGGGSGDQSNNAQNTSVLLGKLLRFNVNTSVTAPFYSIPAGNPFNNEIFDLGLRNPYRWSFDRQTNDIWIGDVGQNSFEEINHRPAGTTGGINYGWRCYEGDNAFNTTGCLDASNYVFPVFNYPTQSPAAVTGGIVYRGTAFPAMSGYYIAADFYSGAFYLINPDGNGGWTTTTQVLPQTGIVDFGETENGDAYVVSLTGNTVYRLGATEGGPLPVTLTSFSGAVVDGAVKLNWKTSAEINLKQYEIEYSLNGASFDKGAGVVSAQNAANGAAYSFTHVINNTGVVFYRLKMVDNDGSFSYSGIIRIIINNINTKLIAPTLITDGTIKLNLTNSTFASMELINANGSRIFTRKIDGQTGRLNIPTGKLTPGMYIVKLTGNDGSAVMEKIVIQ